MTRKIEALKDAILTEWDFCGSGFTAVEEARADGMSEEDITSARWQAAREWDASREEARHG